MISENLKLLCTDSGIKFSFILESTIWNCKDCMDLTHGKEEKEFLV